MCAFPDVSRSMVVSMFTVVVFPEPFGPSSPYISDQTERDRRFTARFSPYSLVNSSADIVSIGSTCPTTDL